MPEIKDIEEEIIEEFSLFDDPMMKYEYLIDLGRQLPPMPEAHKKEENIVKGCQSTVYLYSDFEDGLVRYEADSNTVITKGIISLLIRVLSGRKPEEVLAADLGFIDRINLRTLLSEQRNNGLNAMLKRMKDDAEKYLAKKKNAEDEH